MGNEGIYPYSSPYIVPRVFIITHSCSFPHSPPRTRQGSARDPGLLPEAIGISSAPRLTSCEERHHSYGNADQESADIIPASEGAAPTSAFVLPASRAICSVIFTASAKLDDTFIAQFSIADAALRQELRTELGDCQACWTSPLCLGSGPWTRRSSLHRTYSECWHWRGFGNRRAFGNRLAPMSTLPHLGVFAPRALALRSPLTAWALAAASCFCGGS